MGGLDPRIGREREELLFSRRKAVRLMM